MTQSILTLAGGCFWCLEAVYDRLTGVLDVESGYANGHDPAPTYEAVCSGATGHAEVVRVVYDSEQRSLEDLLKVFFAIHDPTSLNRQGADVGTQYRSGIYWHDPAQVQVIESVMHDLQAQQWWPGKWVTELEAVNNYHPAEDYHQNYFLRHPSQGYCLAVVGPKVSKFRQQFAQWLKPGA